jgi:hypothetical protein
LIFNIFLYYFNFLSNGFAMFASIAFWLEILIITRLFDGAMK